MTKRHVLVTGARGCLGSILCKRLLNDGYFVRALVTSEKNTQWLKDAGAEVFVGDITQPDSLKGICDQTDVVFHLAARQGQFFTKKQYYDSIYEGTKNLLDESLGKIDQFIYCSSYCAMGAGGTTKHLKAYKEDAPIQKTKVYYGDAKFDTEQLILKYAEEKNISYTILRPVIFIGPRAYWVENAISNIKKRCFLPLPDYGKHNAAFIFIDNFVDGIILAATKDIAKGKIYNFRDDYNTTWRQYLLDISKIINKKVFLIGVPFWPAWIFASLLDAILKPFNVYLEIYTKIVVGMMGRDNDIDTTRAKKELGWSTRISYKEALKRIEAWVNETNKF